MDILSIRKPEDRKKILDLCLNLWEKQALVPVIGAGFSLGTQTDNNGAIPTVKELCSELLKYIVRFSNYSQEDIDDIRTAGLANIAGSFWDILKRIPEETISEFYDYFDRNFRGISFFKGFQEAFLTIDWPYLFTLNYDTLVEDYSKKYSPVIPFDKINKHYGEGKTKLYKLHGDVERFLQTSDPKYLILSRDQYVQSMLSDSNKDMLYELLTAFSSKSILFFGCGLTDELDLLYSSQINLNEKAKSVDPQRQAIIYISFESDEGILKEFSQRKLDLLARYGVTKVFRISSEAELEAFFNDFGQSIANVPKSKIESVLERYSAMNFMTLRIDDTRCRDYLFQDNLVWESFGRHQITMPGYCVDRASLEDVVEFVSGNDPLCFLSGNFYSGKTFFMLEIARSFPQRKVYIFPSGTRLSEEQLSALMTMDNILLCFDTKALSTDQIRRITNKSILSALRVRKSNIIIAIDRSDAPMYKYIFEARNVNLEFKLFSVEGRWSEAELKEFNDKIGKISLPPRSRKETILDYVVNNEKKLLGSALSIAHFLEPNKLLFAKDAQRRVQALVMLATEIRIPAKRAIQFNIDRAINDIIDCCKTPGKSSVIEKDYSNYKGDSSGFEYVCNSRYWVIRALSSFASSHNSTEMISDAYLDIINVYRLLYNTNDVFFYQNCEPYYFFDHIQVLFNQRWFANSSGLMNAIYDKLLPILSNSYQFMHQKAKGKLVIAQVQIKNKNYSAAVQTLKEAVFNITRADELASQFPDAKHINETLLHMAYTTGRIYVEYACIRLNYVPQAVNACYRLYQMQNSSQHDVYDFAKSVGDDKWAFNRFKSILLTNPEIKAFSDIDSDKVNYLLSRWTGKKISFTKKKFTRVK